MHLLTSKSDDSKLKTSVRFYPKPPYYICQLFLSLATSEIGVSTATSLALVMISGSSFIGFNHFFYFEFIGLAILVAARRPSGLVGKLHIC